MGESIKLPPGAVLDDSSQMKLPAGATLESAPPKPGFFDRATQGIPKSWHEVAAAAGTPTSWKDAADMLQRGQIPFEPGSAMANSYLRDAGGAIKEGAQEAMDAGGNIAEGGPIGENLGKAAYGGFHAALHLIPGMGPVVETAGQDFQDKNYPAAAGGVLNAAAQYALLRSNPEEISKTKATAPVRAAVRAVNKGLQKAPTTIGTAVGGGLGAATGIPYAGEAGAVIGGAVGHEILPKVKLPGEGFGLPNRIEGGPTSVPDWIDKPPIASDEIGADATRENKPYAGENYGKPWEAQHDATPRNKEYAGEDMGKLLQMPPQEALKIPLSETPIKATPEIDTAAYQQAVKENGGVIDSSISDRALEIKKHWAQQKPGAVGGNGIPGPATVEPSPSSGAYKQAPTPEGTVVPTGDDLTDLLNRSVEKVKAPPSEPQYDADTVAEAKRQLAAQGYDPAHIDKAMELLQKGPEPEGMSIERQFREHLPDEVPPPAFPQEAFDKSLAQADAIKNTLTKYNGIKVPETPELDPESIKALLTKFGRRR